MYTVMKNWILPALLLSRTAVGLQIPLPFDSSVLEKWMPFGQEQVHHYSTVDENEWPINVQQYQNEVVIRVDYSKSRDLKKYLFSTRYSSEDSGEKVVFKRWSNNNIKQYVDLQINEQNLVKLVDSFPSLNYTIIIDDLAQKVFETYPENYEKPSQKKLYSSKKSYQYKATEEVVEATKLNALSELFFKEYRPLETIDAWLEILQQTYPNIITLEDIGHTYEHRSYKVVHFHVPNNDEHGDRKTIVVTGGVHAREWISVSSVLFTIYELLQLYVENPNSKILKELDFLFIPVSNPDGYEYTWTTDRLWRKNRQETIFPRCFGIDIDHSFDFHWTKSSDWACGEEYSGEVPFEAIETQIWEQYLNATNNDHKIWGYIDLHSYAEEVLYPYAYSCSEMPRDEENLIELAYGISKAIRMQSGKTYSVLPACIDKDVDLLPDLGAGNGLDYMYHNRAYWAYQLKLRDSGSHGFLLPGKYIEPVGMEIFAGIKYFCSFILSDDR
ncbi:uncharacterized protein RJT20DRAFT_55478 [Scheffersomyces xylosifermentans]|uniref:uncharacterized protein n=1 Tax=Scheffersomyces xylosifermentans TaxID=1304137 RepID=UPI00315CA3CA